MRNFYDKHYERKTEMPRLIIFVPLCGIVSVEIPNAELENVLDEARREVEGVRGAVVMVPSKCEVELSAAPVFLMHPGGDAEQLPPWGAPPWKKDAPD